MKSTVKKIGFSVMLVFVMACTLLFGVWSLHTGKIARAEEAGTKATLSTNLKNDTTSKGRTFKLTLTLDTNRTLSTADDMYWASIDFVIGLTKVEIPNPTEADATNVDTYNATNTAFISEINQPDNASVQILVASKFSLIPDEETDEFCSRDGLGNGYTNRSQDFLNRSTVVNNVPAHSISIAIPTDHTSGGQSTVNPLKLVMDVKIADDMPMGTYTFGVLSSTISNGVRFGSKGTTAGSDAPADRVINADQSQGSLTFETVSVTITDASDDATLSEVKIGQGTTENPVPADEEFTALDWGTDADNPTTPTYTVTGPDLDKVIIKPVANDSGATMKIGFSATEDTNDPSTDVEVDPANGATITLTPPATGTETTIYIHVTAEDGTTKKTYPVTVKIGYVRLSNLAGSCDAGTLTGVTKNGVAYNEKYDETSSQWVAKDATTPVTVFDSEQKAYHIYILSNAGSIDLTATVAANYGASTSIALAKGADSDALKFTDIPTDGDPVEITSATSGTAFCVTGFPSDPIDSSAPRTYSATLTVTANDAVTTETYTVYFQIVSVNTAINDLKAKGASGVEYTSDAAKVTPGTADNSYNDRIDYYFSLNSETDFEDESGNPKGVAAMLVTLADSAANVYLRTTTDGVTSDLQFGATDKHTVGTHTIVVKAEAGNEQTYIVVFTKPEVLQLVFESDYQFLFRALLIEGGSDYIRAAYDEEAYQYVHGVDDADWDRIVLGQILPNTSVNTFLSNIPTHLYKYINIYRWNEQYNDSTGALDKVKQLVYNRGTAAPEFSSMMDNGSMFPVATGWWIEFGADENNPTDVIYLSILADTDGDGVLTTGDTSALNSTLVGNPNSNFDKDEFLLAAYVAQSGRIAAADVSAINSILTGKTTVQDYYTYKKPATDPTL